MTIHLYNSGWESLCLPINIPAIVGHHKKWSVPAEYILQPHQTLDLCKEYDLQIDAARDVGAKIMQQYAQFGLQLWDRTPKAAEAKKAEQAKEIPSPIPDKEEVDKLVAKNILDGLTRSGLVQVEIPIEDVVEIPVPEPTDAGESAHELKEEDVGDQLKQIMEGLPTIRWPEEQLREFALARNIEVRDGDSKKVILRKLREAKYA